MSENFLSPVGRLVQGDVFEPQLKDQQGRPRVIQAGPNAGQPSPQYFIAVAFAKNDPAWPAFHAQLDAVARAAWPQLFPTPGGPCVLPTFANKIVDGDGFDTTGKPNRDKEGFAGHWIVRFTSGFAPKAYVASPPGSGVYVEITNPAEIKRGYMVRVAGSIKSNDNAQKPGVYVNFTMVERSAFGP